MAGKTIDELKEELNRKLEELLKDEPPMYLDPTPEEKIEVEYKGVVAIYYQDYMRSVDDEWVYHNMEIWKDNKMQLHATLGGPLTKEELLAKLMVYVDENLHNVLTEED